MLSPSKAISFLRIEAGMSVADIGCGCGVFSILALNLVGPSGAVHAIDIQKDLLVRLKREAEEIDNIDKLGTLEIINGDAEKIGGTKLSDNSQDRIILTSIISQVKDKKSFAKEVFRISKPGARILIIDWNCSNFNIGPTKEYEVSAITARDIFEKIGFTFEKDCSIGDYHYGMIFLKPKNSI